MLEDYYGDTLNGIIPKITDDKNEQQALFVEMSNLGELAPLAVLNAMDRNGIDIKVISQDFRNRLAMERSVHDHIAGDNE